MEGDYDKTLFHNIGCRNKILIGKVKLGKAQNS